MRKVAVIFSICASTLCDLASVVGAVTVAGDPLEGSGDVKRKLLTFEELTTGTSPQGPVEDSAFALPKEGAMPRHDFQGALALDQPLQAGSFRELRDDRDETGVGDHERKHLPAMTIELVQAGSHLVPVTQGLAYSESAYWNYIVGPGRAWSEKGDRGWSRASLPFALVKRGQNCTHNGLMTFLYDDSRASNVRFQITQESCLHFKYDMWGQLGAEYSPREIANAETLRGEHAQELSKRLPTRPVAALLEDFPRADVKLAGFLEDIPSQQHITTWGILVNGTNYVSNCPTRSGEYPYCDQMRLPSYSVAKSAFAGVAVMRLGAVKGPGVYQALITEHVPEHTMGDDWSGVTFDHAIDMATGHFADPYYLRDEDTDTERRFLNAESYADKIRFAFEAFPRKAAPGTTWVYHTNDTFIVTQAMQNLVATGMVSTMPSATDNSGAADGARDLFDLVRDDVFAPLGVSKGGHTTLRTDNSPTGRALGGWGLFFTTDDIAKIAGFLNRGDGRIGGRQVLDAARVRESMFRGEDLGLTIADLPNVRVPGTWRYGNGFWGKLMTPAEFPVYPCQFMVSRMGGFGGISVVMMPNGTVFYVWSDHDEFGWYSAVAESHKLASQCGRGDYHAHTADDSGAADGAGAPEAAAATASRTSALSGR